MEQGTLTERYLSEAILKNRRKMEMDGKEVEGSGIGNDFSCMEGIVSADGCGDSPEIAWVKAQNNFSCSGATPCSARLFFLLPVSVKESQIRAYRDCLEDFSSRWRIPILGGHTEISAGVSKPFFVVTLTGSRTRNPFAKGNLLEAEIIMTGFAGMLGNNRLLREKKKELQSCFSDYFLQTAKFELRELETTLASACALAGGKELSCRLYGMHDVSAGGVYSALWQFGERFGSGLQVQNQKINIKQHTIELCERFDLNPYLCDGTGALLLACEKGKGMADYLMSQGIAASVIGTFVEDKTRTIFLTKEDIRTLSPFEGDELNRKKLL